MPTKYLTPYKYRLVSSTYWIKMETELKEYTGMVACPECDKQFLSLKGCKSHMTSVHGLEQDRPYKCSHCEKSFKDRGTLKAHERIHTNDRPFPCSYCDKKYCTSSDRKKHERFHTNEKPYRCTVCDK